MEFHMPPEYPLLLGVLCVMRLEQTLEALCKFRERLSPTTPRQTARGKPSTDSAVTSTATNIGASRTVAIDQTWGVQDADVGLCTWLAIHSVVR